MTPVALVVAIALGAALRLVGLSSESLWLDEGITAWRMRQTFADLLLRWSEGTQGSLYYLVLWNWCSVFGTSEAAMRFPSAVCGILTIPIVERLGRRWFGAAAGATAALLLAVSPFAIHYSQEARPYAAFLLLATVSTLFLARLIDGDGNRRDAALYVVTTAAAVCIHAYGIFLLVAHLVVREIFEWGDAGGAASFSRRRFAKLAVAASVISAPAIARFALEYTKVVDNTSAAGWIPDAGLAILGRTLAQYFGGAWIAAAASVLTAVILAKRAREDARMAPRVFSAFVIASAFVLLPFVISLFGESIYFPRYTLPALAAVVVLTGAAVASLRAPARAVVIAAFLIALAPTLSRYYTLVDKDPWRETASLLEAKAHAGDVIAVFPHWMIRPLEYYLRAPEGVHVVAVRDSASVERVRSAPARVFLVSAYDGKPAVEARLDDALEDGFLLEDEMNVNDGLAVNPTAVHVATIRVSRYSHREPGTADRSSDAIASRSAPPKENP